MTSNVAGHKHGYDDKFIYFQHRTGQLRWIYQGGPDTWSGGTINEIIATDAKNGTPISALSPSGTGGLEYDVYCEGSTMYASIEGDEEANDNDAIQT